MFYRWQKDFFENGPAALDPASRRASDSKDRQIALLEQKLHASTRSSRNSWRNIFKLKKSLGEL